WVHSCEHGTDDAVLARRVEALQHEQHASRRLGEQACLELREPLGEVGAELLRLVLVVEALEVASVSLRELGTRAGCDDEGRQHAGDSSGADRLCGFGARSGRPTYAGTRARLDRARTSRSGPIPPACRRAGRTA